MPSQSHQPNPGHQPKGDTEFLDPEDRIVRKPPSLSRTFVTAALVGLAPQLTLPPLGDLKTAAGGPCQATGAAVCGCPTPSNSGSREQQAPRNKEGRTDPFLPGAGRGRRSKNEPQGE